MVNNDMMSVNCNAIMHSQWDFNSRNERACRKAFAAFYRENLR